MSVCPGTHPGGTALSSREGALVSVSIQVDPRNLEILLEALSTVSFPINPQIYHDAAVVYTFPDGHQKSEPTTLVEFPAYESRLGEVRDALGAYAFDPSDIEVTGMLEDLHAGYRSEEAASDAAYVSRRHLKRRAVAAVH